MHGRKVRELRYADDTALLSTTAEGLTTLIQATKEHSEDMDLSLNIRKTKIMDNIRCQEKSNIKIENKTIENVDSFDYLGATFRGDGTSRQEIRKRLAIVMQKLKKMWSLWKGLEMKTKIKLLKTCTLKCMDANHGHYYN